MSNIHQEIRIFQNPNLIKFPFDAERSPRTQIEAAIAPIPPRRCERHPDELQAVNQSETVRRALLNEEYYSGGGWTVKFTATYERCAKCPHSANGPDINIEHCPVGNIRTFKTLATRDEKGRPLPRCPGSAQLEAELSAREQFDAWLAPKSDLWCTFSNQALRRRDAHMVPPFASWAIEPKFPHCLKCSLQSLGIATDETHASFENFVTDHSALQENLAMCRAFAAAPKGVLLLLGNCGTGKTHLGIAIMRELLRRGKWGLVFIKHRHFLADHRLASRPVAFGDERPESPLTRCGESRFLFYDELTAPTDNRADEDVLLDLFEMRIGNYRPSIITANLSPGELEPVLGTRLHDRLRRAAFAVLEFGFESRRPSLNDDYLRRSA